MHGFSMVDPVAQLLRAAVDFNCGCLGLSFLSVQVLLHGMHLDREQVSCREENPKRLDIPELDLPLGQWNFTRDISCILSTEVAPDPY